ncbi:MAG TPA: hypothetical protein VGO31_00410 [Microbacteriaceae bacterium]|nr:hypothetical protein [Microbacteriaceae bacterium]
MKPYGFLFDADMLERIATGGYHEPALRAFFEAVLEADVRGEERFLLFHGDLMVYSLARRTVSVKSRKTVHGRRPERTEGIDRDLWTTVVCYSHAGGISGACSDHGGEN